MSKQNNEITNEVNNQNDTLSDSDFMALFDFSTCREPDEIEIDENAKPLTLKEFRKLAGYGK